MTDHAQSSARLAPRAGQSAPRGPVDAAAGPVHAVLHHPGGRTEDVLELRAGLAAARSSGGLLWAELDHPEMADFTEVEAVFDLHPLAVEDAVSARDRPKLDLYDGTRFLTLITLPQPRTTAGSAATSAPLLAVGPREVGRIMAFAGDGFVVTVRQEDGDTIARARRELVSAEAVQPTSLHALHALLNTVVDDLVGISRVVEDAVLGTAERLFARAADDESRPLYDITLQLLAMAHAVNPLVEPLRHLSRGDHADGIELELSRRFQDVLDHALVLDRELTDYRELVEQLRASNDSRIALQQNTDMRKISAWAAIIAVPTAVTGFYGMNVPYPGQGQAAGVVVAVAAQLLLALSLFGVFRRRGWL